MRNSWGPLGASPTSGFPHPESSLLSSVLQGEPGQVIGGEGPGLPGQKGDPGPPVSSRVWWRGRIYGGVGENGGLWGYALYFVSSIRVPLDLVGHWETQDPGVPQDFLEQL